MAIYTIYVRDRDRNRVAEADDFRLLEMVLRFNVAGSWLLELPAGGNAASLLTWGGGIVVTRDDTVILSGPVRRLERRWNGDEDVLIGSGPDDLVWLQDATASPDPTGPPYGAAYDVRTNLAETVLREYVDNNVGPSARPERRVPGLTLAADAGLGATITGRARFGNLLELLQSLALAGGDLGFRVVQSVSNLEFQVYQPADKTATVVFSKELGNLRAFGYVAEAAETNYVICGGGGEGVLRTVVEKGDSASVVRYGRIEMFRDRRDTTDAGELMQTIDEELAQRAERTELRIEPVDTQSVAFMTDYQLGDRVTAVVDGVATQDILREVQIVLSADEAEVVTPTLGTPGTTRSVLLGLFARIRQLGRQVSNLERR